MTPPKERNHQILSVSEVESIWVLRNEGKIHECEEAFFSLCTANGVLPGSSVTQQIGKLVEQGHSPELACEFILLRVSFLRRQGAQKLANQALSDVRERYEALGVPLGFQWYFQAGLVFLCDSNLSRSLEAFLRAKGLARTPREFHSADINTIVVMEGLGYDYESSLAKFYETFQDQKANAWALPLLQEYENLVGRSSFRRSDYGRLREFSVSQDKPEAGAQGLYLATWFGSLPYFQFASDAVPVTKLVQRLLDEPTAYLINYRVRTLRELLIPEDLKSDVKIEPRIERFYLWVWKWLTDPNVSRLRKLQDFKAHFHTNMVEHCADIHYQLLENALSWLALFSGQRPERVELSLNSIVECATSDVPFLAYEKKLLEALFLLRDGQADEAKKLLQALGKSPVVSEKGFLLPSLVSALNGEGTVAPPMAALLESLKTFEPFLKDKRARSIQVDVLAQRIKVLGTRPAELLSPSLVGLFVLFQKTDHCQVTEALEGAFGLGRYEPLVHDPKMAALLTRANQVLLPPLRLSRKANLVYLVGDRGALQFRGGNAHTLSALRVHLNTLLEPTAQADTNLNRAPSEKTVVTRVPQGWVERTQLEDYLALSRSTALRRIQTWLDQGKLERQGVGKSTRYFVTKNLEKELMEKMSSRSGILQSKEAYHA